MPRNLPWLSAGELGDAVVELGAVQCGAADAHAWGAGEAKGLVGGFVGLDLVCVCAAGERRWEAWGRASLRTLGGP